MRRVRALLVLAVALAVAGVTLRLGLWQAQRHQQRSADHAAFEAALRAEPRAIDPGRDSLGSLEGRRVACTGTWDESAPVLLSARIHDGMPGVHLVTPLVLADGSALLVDRGWVGADDARLMDPARLREPGTRTVVGLLESLPRGVRGPAWTALDTAGTRVWSTHALAIDSAQARLGAHLLPVLLHALPEPGRGGEPVRRDPRPADPMMHFWYAVQWFALSAGALVGGALLARRVAAPPAAPGGRGTVGAPPPTP
jgi:cytochrome oxidase assembly protein ShyY1